MSSEPTKQDREEWLKYAESRATYWVQRFEEQKTFFALKQAAWWTAESKGFHEDKTVTFGDRIALIHSEASEALEAYRRNRDTSPYTGENGKPEGVPSELADVIIRVCDLAEEHGVQGLYMALLDKLKYNLTREPKHGKSF